MQEVKSGFSLGAAASATVRVLWPGGTEATFTEVPANQLWHLVYGQEVQRSAR